MLSSLADSSVTLIISHLHEDLRRCHGPPRPFTSLPWLYQIWRLISLRGQGHLLRFAHDDTLGLKIPIPMEAQVSLRRRPLCKQGPDKLYPSVSYPCSIED